jgi:hypothetical protein
MRINSKTYIFNTRQIQETCGRNQVGLTTGNCTAKYWLGNSAHSGTNRRRGSIDHTWNCGTRTHDYIIQRQWRCLLCQVTVNLVRSLRFCSWSPYQDHDQLRSIIRVVEKFSLLLMSTIKLSLEKVWQSCKTDSLSVNKDQVPLSVLMYVHMRAIEILQRFQWCGTQKTGANPTTFEFTSTAPAL